MVPTFSLSCFLGPLQLHLVSHSFLRIASSSPWTLVAQMVKNPPAMRETWVPSLGWEDSPRGVREPLVRRQGSQVSMRVVKRQGNQFPGA